jgi:HME family heavy-metal exporter
MFRMLLDSSLKNRLLVLFAALVLTLYGLLTLTQTPVDVFPDLNKPTVTVISEAGGMASEEVEQLISAPLETALNGLPGVEVIRSISSAGLSFIYITFNWDTEIYRARQMVSERLSNLEGSIPANVKPQMGPVSSIMGEIMQIAIPIDPKKMSAMQVREYADWVLRPRLLSIQGVAQVIPIGGEVRQFQVHPKLQRMVELGVSIEDLQQALKTFSANTSGGFLSLNGREYLIRHLGRTSSLEDLGNVAVGARQNKVVLLKQVAEVSFSPAIKRGDAGFEGQPAVILGIQKQPAANTIALTKHIEEALQAMESSLPTDMEKPRLTFRQASFIEASIQTLQGKLIGASLCVALVLFFFLGTLRPTIIALTAIPVSIFVTALVFNYFGLSINTMTLGGLAIAIGGLVDDAVVDVENILRRLKEQRRHPNEPFNLIALVQKASMEVRTGIVYATAIIVLVFLPLFALPGIEGRLFVPLGVAFIVSTLASLIVSVTVTPVLSYYLLPGIKNLDHGDTVVVAWLKHKYRITLNKVLNHPKITMTTALLAVLLAAASVPFFSKTFLPPFNEGTLLIGMRLNPGVTLEESSRLAAQAEQLLKGIPEITHIGRRSGRAELDEHAEGVHVSELDIGLIPAAEMTRPMSAIQADIRARLKNLPAAIAVGQPISHRIDHMMSGVRSQIAIKVFGEDLDTLRSTAEQLRTQLSSISGLVDLEIEKQVLAPEVKVRIHPDVASQYGVSTSDLLSNLEFLVEGETITQVIEGNRRFALVLKLSEPDRGLEQLKTLLIPTPMGTVPLSTLATIEDSDGPNQISRDDGRRRIVISANAQGRALSDVVSDIRALTSKLALPEGYFITLGGQFEAQEEASRLVGLLSIISLALMFAVLYSRYQSTRLSLIIMGNIPLALVGSMAGLWLSGQPLSVAALIGFVTLAGISVRNGILKVSHYINLMRFEQEQFTRDMILRGSLERLSPVLMTALVTAFALAPLLFEANRPGTEILNPVAVVIFGGLMSSTLLDTYLTPLLFWRFGKKDAEQLLASNETESM